MVAFMCSCSCSGEEVAPDDSRCLVSCLSILRANANHQRSEASTRNEAMLDGDVRVGMEGQCVSSVFGLWWPII